MCSSMIGSLFSSPIRSSEPSSSLDGTDEQMELDESSR